MLACVLAFVRGRHGNALDSWAIMAMALQSGVYVHMWASQLEMKMAGHTVYMYMGKLGMLTLISRVCLRV